MASKEALREKAAMELGAKQRAPPMKLRSAILRRSAIRANSGCAAWFRPLRGQLMQAQPRPSLGHNNAVQYVGSQKRPDQQDIHKRFEIIIAL